MARIYNFPTDAFAASGLSTASECAHIRRNCLDSQALLLSMIERLVRISAGAGVPSAAALIGEAAALAKELGAFDPAQVEAGRQANELLRRMLHLREHSHVWRCTAQQQSPDAHHPAGRETGAPSK